ncbi:hypothetical protein M1506_00750, partial [Patescibacteria group bacterium]|nr:hypothetical protein [Patescibacteria group bacterium]
MPKKRIFLAVLVVTAVFLPAFFALAFTGPTQSPPNGSGVLTVDSNGNFGLLPSGSTATPEQGGFGKVFTVASSTNPGFSMLNTTAGSRYTWYEDNGGKLNLWYNTPTVGYSRLTVSPAGYLGVNTSSPATTLDVNGNAQSSIYYDRDNTNYYLDLAANTLPYSALFSGSVGIGTTNPSAKLEIDSSDATAYSATAQGITPVGSDILVLSNPNASANFSSLYFGAGSSGSGVGRIAVLTSGGGVGTMVFQLRDGSGGDGYTPEKMRISYNGNVGIGTTSPGAKLTVAGAGQFTSFSNPSSGLGVEIGHDGVEGILQSYNRTSPGWSPLWINGSNVILQNSSGGKVGIGTTNPVTELTTYGQGDNLTVQSGSDNTGVRHSIVFQGGATNVEARIMSGNYGSYNGGLDFQVASHSVASTTTNSALFILYNGDVGIGTTNPLTAGLVVSTNVGGAAIDVTNNRIINLGTPVNANDAATKGYVDSAYVPGGSAGNVGGTGTSGYVPKWTSTSTIANSLIYDNGTNVGIGTTNPGQKLEVEGSVLGRAAATGNTWGYYLNSTAGVSVAKFEVAGSDTNHAVTLGAISNNPLYFITANSTRVTIYNTGNV